MDIRSFFGGRKGAKAPAASKGESKPKSAAKPTSTPAARSPAQRKGAKLAKPSASSPRRSPTRSAASKAPSARARAAPQRRSAAKLAGSPAPKGKPAAGSVIVLPAAGITLSDGPDSSDDEEDNPAPTSREPSRASARPGKRRLRRADDDSDSGSDGGGDLESTPTRAPKRSREDEPSQGTSAPSTLETNATLIVGSAASDDEDDAASDAEATTSRAPPRGRTARRSSQSEASPDRSVGRLAVSTRAAKPASPPRRAAISATEFFKAGGDQRAAVLAKPVEQEQGKEEEEEEEVHTKPSEGGSSGGAAGQPESESEDTPSADEDIADDDVDEEDEDEENEEAGSGGAGGAPSEQPQRATTRHGGNGRGSAGSVVDLCDADDADGAEKAPAAKRPRQARQTAKAVATKAASSASSSSSSSSGSFSSRAAVAAKPSARPLASMRVCVTGVLASMTRGEATTIIQHFGGTVSASAGMQLDLLVCGSRLEDGREVQEGSKYAKALEAQKEQQARLSAFQADGGGQRKQPKAPLRIVGEDKFLAMLPGRAEAEIKQLKEGMAGANSHRRRALDMGSALAQADDYARRKREAASAKPLASSSSSSSASAAAPSLMWVDKYAPETADDLVGNTAAFERLLYWLQNWDELHAGGPPVKGARGAAKTPKPALPAKGRPATLRADKHNIYARAALLSGAPGIGKSTSARLVAATCGRQVVELNASDKRNAKTLAMSLRPVTSGIRVLTMGGAAGSPMLGAGAGGVSGGRGKHVVIMDEVDGLAGNDDRGGTRELISIIAKTRVPIICICNDRSNTKVRSLLSHCLDLPYTRPRKDAIAKRVASIAQREGLGVDPAAIQVLAEAVGGDVRQVLHTMESWGRRAKRSGTGNAPMLSAITMKAELVSTDKDAILRHTGFSAAEQLLLVGTGESAMRPADRLRQLTELFFVDYDLVPLLLQQNYVPSLSGQRDLGSAAAVSRAAYAAQAFADADVLGSRLRSQGQWGLLPATAALNVRGALAARGGAKMRSSFPEWFAKNSTSNKRRRLLAELSTHMSARVWGLPGRSGLVMDHLSVLRERVFRPLFAASAVSKGVVSDEKAEEMLAAWSDPPAPELWQAGEEDDSEMPPLRRLVRAGVGVMGEYGLSKDDAMESLCELRLGAVVDPRTDINTKTKLAITREYGNLRIRSQALVEEQGVTAAARKRKASRSMAAAAAEGGGSDDEGGAAGDEDDDGDAEIDLEAFQAKARAKTRAGSAKKKGRAGSAKARR